MRLRIAFVPLVLSQTALAQTTPIRVGLFAGLNEAKVDGSNLSDISNHSAGAFGGYVALPLSPEWRLSVGAGYSMKGVGAR
jgi:hypothetical protein